MARRRQNIRPRAKPRPTTVSVEDFSADVTKIVSGILQSAVDGVEGVGAEVTNAFKDLEAKMKSEKISPDKIAAYITTKLEQELIKGRRGEIPTAKIAAVFQKIMGISNELKGAFKDALDAEARLTMGIRDFANDASDSIVKPFDVMTNYIEKIPGGKLLSSALGLDDISRRIKVDIADSIRTTMKSSGTAMEKFKTIGTQSFSAIGKSAQAAFAHPILLAITAIIALLYIAYKQWNKTIEAAKTLRDETGLTGERAKDLSVIGADIAKKFTAMGVDMAVVGKNTAALVNEFQNADLISKEMILNASILTGVLGVTEQAAAKVTRQFKVMGGLNDEMSGNLMASVAHLSDLGGVAPAKIFEDMAESTKEINTYFKGNVIEAAKAAIELRRMGTSLKEAAAVAKSMVDFESSITAELEASVLLGRQLDFSAARYYAWTGDIANQQKEILRQVGSIDKFNRMMPFQKEALAKATGMEVEQLANMLYQQKEINRLVGEGRYGAYKKSLDVLEEFRKANKIDLLQQAQRMLEWSRKPLAERFDKGFFTQQRTKS